MEFTNVLPGVKLVKQDEAGNEEELFVSQNDHVIVKTLNGRETKVFLCRLNLQDA